MLVSCRDFHMRSGVLDLGSSTSLSMVGSRPKMKAIPKGLQLLFYPDHWATGEWVSPWQPKRLKNQLPRLSRSGMASTNSWKGVVRRLVPKSPENNRACGNVSAPIRVRLLWGHHEKPFLRGCRTAPCGITLLPEISEVLLPPKPLPAKMK